MLRLALLACLLSTGACATTAEDSARTAPADLPAASDTASAPSCADLAAKLAVLLAEAQRCNPAAQNPTQCASWVPSTDGCSQPVAAPGSEATQAYLKLFDVYAGACPLPDPPCVDPTSLAVDCTQDADADGLAGRCTILD